jgi:hypothetical protein
MHYYAAGMRICRLVCFFCLFCFTRAQAQVEGFVDSIERVKEAVIPVACATWPDEDGKISIKQIMGTGFFVNYEGSFITAAHVISDRFKWYKNERPSADCFPVVYIPNPTWIKYQWFQFQNCITDAGVDVAVCKTIQTPFLGKELHARWLRLSTKTVKEGTSVAFTGFPQNILVPITSRANVAAVGEFFSAGRIDIVIDKTNWHGVSGGPLYLSDGTVIGIMRERGEGLWDGLAFARDMTAILRFLSDHHVIVAKDEPDGEATKSKKKNGESGQTTKH